MITFQELIRRLSLFWEKQGCATHQGYDLEVGAGTSNPATFLRSLGPEPYKAAYVEPSRRPSDGRYGANPNRLQHYFQFQVILKPSPPDILDTYLKSLEAIGFDLKEHDIRFVHDDWENPTLGAWGLGWEVWMDGMEITQFTYFQAVGGLNLKPITGEITYGIERLAMYLQKVNSILDIQWNDKLKYGDIYLRSEIEWSHYNFERASIEMWSRHFQDYEREAKQLMAQNLPLPAYDFVLKASHAFNILDARGAISVTERTGYIGRIRDLSKQIAESYAKSRQEQSYPLLERFKEELEAPLLSLKAMPAELLQIDPSKKDDFVLEVGSEELPATFVPIGAYNLKHAFKELLHSEGIGYESIEVYGTPRRLSVCVKQLSLGKAPQTSEKKGPPVAQAFDDKGALSKTGEGFFRSLGKSPSNLEAIRSNQVPDISIRSIKGIDYLYAALHTPGRATAEILSEKIPGLILNMDFPKKMRWGNLDITYARPIRWIAALFGKHVIPFIVGDIESGRQSTGHRQLDPGVFSIDHAKDYLQILKKHHVMADMEERKAEIIKQLKDLEKSLDAKIICQEQVIPQVLNLVEWPHLTYADFDSSYLKAPKEVLVSEMVEHQKYFPVANADGSLQNRFIITANTNPSDEIRRGNQKVLSARLSDGVFLYSQGMKTPLSAYNEKLKNVVFQKELGSVYDKVLRIKAHALTLQNFLKIGDPLKVERAAELSKADLASEMVFEFPELQGIIGRYYAEAQNEPSLVAAAIEEQWMPRGENAPLPKTAEGTILSLSDKIDNLLGCFLANLKPTSSSDPYALRRQTLGIIKILIKGEHHLPLKKLLTLCFEHFPKNLQSQKEALLPEIEAFIANRIKTVFLDYGVSKDEIEASLSSGFTDIYDAYLKVKSLHRFREESKQFPLLFEVYKRAKGQIAEAKDGQGFKFSEQLLKENAEKNLHLALNKNQIAFEQALESRNYDKAYTLIAEIQAPLAALFDEVKILSDDLNLQHNRIALLQRVFTLFSQLLDFGKIQEEKR